MLIFTQDRKSMVDARLIQVQRNIGGGKDGKFMLMAFGESTGAVAAAVFPDEKTAMDALEKVFAAFEGGASSYKF